MYESELKFVIEKSFELPSFAPDETNVTSVRELEPLELRATYYDTQDLRLARSGITLRWRQGDEEGPGWTLKLPVQGTCGVVRRELLFEGTQRVVPAQAGELVTAFARSARLGPVARVRTKRKRFILEGGDSDELAHVSEDSVFLVTGRRATEAFRELEVEARSLDRPGLERIGASLEASGAVRGKGVPKLVRVLGRAAAEPPDAAMPEEQVGPRDPSGAALRSSMAAGLQRLLWNDPGTRLGEAEPLHQMRVAARRMRSDLRTFEPLTESQWAAGLIVDLKWLGGLLGRVRDLDVLKEKLQRSASDLRHELAPFFASLEDQRSTEHVVLLDAMRSPRYTELLERLVHAARDPVLTAAAALPCEEVLPSLVRKSWKKVVKTARGVGPNDAEEDLHRVRILAKRARYAAEAVGPFLDVHAADASVRFASRAATLQDVLGAVQDAAMARAMIERLALRHSTDGPLNFAAGRLLARQEEAAGEARSHYPEAWERFARKKNRKWMKS